MAFRVEKRIAFAFPVFKIYKFCSVMPMASANSFERIFRFASITSTFTIIVIGIHTK